MYIYIHVYTYTRIYIYIYIYIFLVPGSVSNADDSDYLWELDQMGRRMTPKVTFTLSGVVSIVCYFPMFNVILFVLSSVVCFDVPHLCFCNGLKY